MHDQSSHAHPDRQIRLYRGRPVPSAIDGPEMERLYIQEGWSCKRIGTKYRTDGGNVASILRLRGVGVSQGRRRYELNESAFDDTANPDALYWAGFLMADGCVHCASGSSTLVITLSLATRDRGHVEKFRMFLGSNHPLYLQRSRVRPDGDAFSGATGSASLSLCSNRLAASLAQFGVIPRKTFVARAAQAASMSADFWRGCVDGDGCLGIYTKRGKQRFHFSLIGTPALLSQFSQFVSQSVAAAGPNVRPHPRVKSIAEVSLSGHVAVEVVRLLYGQSRVSLDRKQAIADKVIANPGGCTPSPRSAFERKYCYKNRTYNLTALSELTGYKIATIWRRLQVYRWTVERTVETPVRPIRV